MNEKAENSAYNAWLLCMLDAQSLHVFCSVRSALDENKLRNVDILTGYHECSNCPVMLSPLLLLYVFVFFLLFHEETTGNNMT